MGVGKDFLFRIRPDLVHVMRGKMLLGKERLKIQAVV